MAELGLTARVWRRQTSHKYLQVPMTDNKNDGGGARSQYRHCLPQLSGDLFLTDAGLENKPDIQPGHRTNGVGCPHTATAGPRREAMAVYYRSFLKLALDYRAGFILDSQTWKAHPRWAEDLHSDEDALRQANRDSIDFIAGLRDEFPDNPPIVLCGIIGPRGDAYAPSTD